MKRNIVFVLTSVAVLLACFCAGCTRHNSPRETVTASYELVSDDGTVKSGKVEMSLTDRAENALPALLGEMRSPTGFIKVTLAGGIGLPVEIEGRAVEGKTEGPVRVFITVDGKRVLSSETNFLHDRKHGKATAYLPGDGLNFEGTWENGVKSGHWLFCYRHGVRAIEANFKGDQFDGPVAVFDANGEEVAHGIYAAGRPRDGTFIDDPWRLVHSIVDPTDIFETTLVTYSDGIRREERTVRVAKTAKK